MRRRTFLKAIAASAGLSIIGGAQIRSGARSNDLFPVYLTFDDGPTTERNGIGPTTRVLDTLRDQAVSATFFLHGIAMNRWEGPVIARMLKDSKGWFSWLWRRGARKNLGNNGSAGGK